MGQYFNTGTGGESLLNYLLRPWLARQFVTPIKVTDNPSLQLKQK